MRLDSLTPREIVAELDNEEYVQAVAQARANLAVAQANVAGAQSALAIAARELDRMQKLRKEGMATEAQFDTARANHLDKTSRLAVVQALVSKADSELQSANIRLSYTKVIAGWRDGSDRRFVAERFVDEGQTVAANGPLLRIPSMYPMLILNK